MNKSFALGRSNILTTIAVCGLAIMTFPQKAQAFLGMNCPFEKNSLLACAVSTVGQQANLDIVVVNIKGVIIADTICSNVGKKYPHAKRGEVTSTLADGKCRTFVEISQDYPKGINEKVTAIKNKKGHIIGAVIVSTDSIPKNCCKKH